MIHLDRHFISYLCGEGTIQYAESTQHKTRDLDGGFGGGKEVDLKNPAQLTLSESVFNSLGA